MRGGRRCAGVSAIGSGEVYESEGVAAQGFQAAVDGFGGSVGSVVIEVGQYVGVAAPQGTAQLCQFLDGGGHAAAQSVDARGHHGLAAAPVGLAVGGDDALIDAPGHQDRQVVIIGEDRAEPG